MPGLGSRSRRRARMATLAGSVEAGHRRRRREGRYRSGRRRVGSQGGATATAAESPASPKVGVAPGTSGGRSPWNRRSRQGLGRWCRGACGRWPQRDGRIDRAAARGALGRAERNHAPAHRAWGFRPLTHHESISRVVRWHGRTEEWARTITVGAAARSVARLSRRDGSKAAPAAGQRPVTMLARPPICRKPRSGRRTHRTGTSAPSLRRGNVAGSGGAGRPYRSRPS